MNHKILIIALTLLIVGGMIFVSIMTYHGWDFSKLDSGSYETENHEISEPFSAISISTDVADVKILPSADGKVKVSCFENIKMKHSVSIADGTLKIELCDERAWYDHIGLFFTKQTVTVYLPEAEYGSLNITASTGEVSVPCDFKFLSIGIDAVTADINCEASAEESITVSATTGDIILKNASANSVSLSVTTGDIKASAVSCTTVFQAKCSSGDIELSGVSCRDLISTGSTGNIKLSGVISSGDFRVERGTGDITLDRCDGAELHIKTTTGDVCGTLLTDKTFLARASTGDVTVPENTSGGRCEINTKTGDIIISIAK